MQNQVPLPVDRTQIVEPAKEVGNQLSVIGSVFKTADGFKFTGQMIRNLINRCLSIEAAIPSATCFVIKSVSAGACMRESGIDERKAGSTKH